MSTDLFLGLDVGQSRLRLARYVVTENGVELVHEARLSLDENLATELPLAIKSALEEVGARHGALRRPIVSVSVGDDVAIIREEAMSIGKGRARERAARYLAANTSRFNAWKIDDCIVKSKAIPPIDPQDDSGAKAGRRRRRQQGATYFLVAKALREPLGILSAALKRAGVGYRIEHRSFALRRSVPNADAILYIGETSSQLYAYSRVHQDQVIPMVAPATAEIDELSEVEMNRLLVRELGISPHEATTYELGEELGPLQYRIEQFAGDIEAAVSRLRDERSAHIEQIVIVGECSRFRAIASLLTQRLDVSVQIASLPELSSEDLPVDILDRRAPELVVTLGSALLAVEQNQTHRLNLAGPDVDARRVATIDGERLRRLVLIPIAATIAIAGAFLYEGIRESDMTAQQQRAEAGANRARAAASQVHVLESNVAQLVAVYGDLEKIRGSAVRRTKELSKVGNKLYESIRDGRVVSVTAVDSGWQIAGKAKTPAEVGDALAAVRKALPDITAAIAERSSRPEGQPDALIDYTIDVQRTAAPAAPAAPGKGNQAPSVPAALMIVGASLVTQRRTAVDGRLVYLCTLAAFVVTYMVVIDGGEKRIAQAERARDVAIAVQENLDAAVQYRRELNDLRLRVTTQIGNLTPENDETSLLAATYKALDGIVRQHSKYQSGTLVTGAWLQSIVLKSGTNGSDNTQRQASIAASQGRITAEGQVAPTPAPISAPAPSDQSAFAIGGASDPYVTVVPMTIVFEGSYDAVLDCLQDLSTAPVLIQVRSASISVIGGNGGRNPTVHEILDTAAYMPLSIDPQGNLVPKRAPAAGPRRLQLPSGPNAAGVIPGGPSR